MRFFFLYYTLGIVILTADVIIQDVVNTLWGIAMAWDKHKARRK